MFKLGQRPCVEIWRSLAEENIIEVFWEVRDIKSGDEKEAFKWLMLIFQLWDISSAVLLYSDSNDRFQSVNIFKKKKKVFCFDHKENLKVDYLRDARRIQMVILKVLKCGSPWIIKSEQWKNCFSRKCLREWNKISKK